MRTGAAMTREVVVVPPELDVHAARQIMNRHNVRHLPVVKSGGVVGIVSDRDLLVYEHKIDSLPVVDPSGALVGLVTSTDLLNLLIESAETQVLPFHYKLRLCEEPEGEVA
jgi:CBS domain-containing protein